VSGIFSALRRRPKFKISLIDGPTFCCTFSNGAKRGDDPVHRTCIALYLALANVVRRPQALRTSPSRITGMFGHLAYCGSAIV
jgi:hypothetical protein